MAMREQPPWRTVLLVGVVAAIAATLVTASWEFGAERIAANESAKLLESLNSVLDERHTGADVTPVRFTVTSERLNADGEPADVFVPMRAGTPVAAVIATVAPNGYNAPISLLVGIDAESGTIAGVRVVSHRETPGLGDLIDIGKSRWITQFDARSLTDPPAERWRVRQEDGEFDALTGATVTARAVIEAVRIALIYFRENEEALFATARETAASGATAVGAGAPR